MCEALGVEKNGGRSVMQKKGASAVVSELAFWGKPLQPLYFEGSATPRSRTGRGTELGAAQRRELAPQAKAQSAACARRRRASGLRPRRRTRRAHLGQRRSDDGAAEIRSMLLHDICAVVTWLLPRGVAAARALGETWWPN